MKYYVTENCVGCGACWSTCPEVFDQGGDGCAVAVKEAVEGKTADLAMLAKDSCPVSAIISEE